MSVDLIVWLRTWEEMRSDFGIYWFIYGSMPFVAALIGWGTKLVAVEMLYRPIEFKGIGPFGWQGIVPRRAGKVASKTIELLMDNLLDPAELLDKVDTRRAVEEIRGPLTGAIDEIARELADQVRPGLWAALPEAGRRAVIAKVQADAPKIADRLLAEIRSDISRYLDVQYLAVTTLVRNKEKLNNLMRTMAGDASRFMRRSGIWFGLAIGSLQVLCWAAFKVWWIMPAFGFAVGFLSDWIALTMLFRPQYEKRYFGLIRHQGLLHAKREKITRDYARILAEDLFSPEAILDALLHGPSAEKLLSLMATEIDAAIDAQAGIASPALPLLLGSKRYRAIKSNVASLVLARLPETLGAARDYAEEVVDLENTVVDKMSQLSNEDYESILRPVFKDDEPTIIAVGAILGAVVGEIQVLLVELVEHHYP